MKYLEKELKYMNENLVQENFNRYLNFFFFSVTKSVCFSLLDMFFIVSFSLLTPLWMNSVKILHQMSQLEDSNLVYFQRLLYTLQVSSAFQSNPKYYTLACNSSRTDAASKRVVCF